jgi:uncharacterized protein with GYD domain
VKIMSSKDFRSKKIRAFVLITMRPGTSEEIVQSRKVKGVKLANSVLGRFDAVAMIEADNSNELASIIYEMIEKNPYVVRTETLLSMFIP